MECVARNYAPDPHAPGVPNRVSTVPVCHRLRGTATCDYAEASDELLALLMTQAFNGEITSAA